MGLISLITQGFLAASLMGAPHQSHDVNDIIKTNHEIVQNEATEIEPSELYIVTEIEGSQQANQKPKKVTIDDKVNLHAVLKAKENNKPVYFSNAKNIKINGKKINPKQIKPWPKTKEVNLEWFKVEPIKKSYSYVNSGNKIKYEETKFDQGWTTSADVHPTYLIDQFPEEKTGVGVMRYKVKLATDDKTLSTPGKNESHKGGISDKLVRVSFRPNTGSWVDYVFELFNTPYIWGSRTKQIDGQVGSDCADFALYGWRRTGKKLPYTWSYGLKDKKYTKNVATIDGMTDNGHFLDKKGKEITYSQVNEGDVILYPRHIAVLYKDNGNKVFDCDDLVLHTLFEEPKIDTVCEAYGTPEEVLRWKK